MNTKYLIFGTARAVVSVIIGRNNEESCAIGYTGRNEANIIIEKSGKTYTVTEHRDKKSNTLQPTHCECM